MDGTAKGELHIRIEKHAKPWMVLTWTGPGLKICVEIESSEDEDICAEGLESMRRAIAVPLGENGADDAIRQLGAEINAHLAKKGVV